MSLAMVRHVEATVNAQSNGRLARTPAFLASVTCSILALGTVLTACSSSGVTAASTAGVEYLSYEKVFASTDDLRFYRFDVRDGCLVVSSVDGQSADAVAALSRSWQVDADGVTLSDGTRVRWGDIVGSSGSVNVVGDDVSALPKGDCVTRYGGYRAMSESATSYGALDPAEVERRGVIPAYTLRLIRAVDTGADAESVRVADADPALLPEAPPTSEQAMRTYLDAYLAGDEWGPATMEGLGGSLPASQARGAFAHLVAIRDMRSVWTISPGANKAALLVLLNAADVDIESDPRRPRTDEEGRTGLYAQVYGAPDSQRNDSIFFSAETARLLGTFQSDSAAAPDPDGVIRPVETIYWD